METNLIWLSKGAFLLRGKEAFLYITSQNPTQYFINRGLAPLLIKGGFKLTGTKTCINLPLTPRGTHFDL